MAKFSTLDTTKEKATKTKRTVEQPNDDFTAGEAWTKAWQLEMLRRYGSQREVSRREGDKEYMKLVKWAEKHPQPSPLTR